MFYFAWFVISLLFAFLGKDIPGMSHRLSVFTKFCFNVVASPMFGWFFVWLFFSEKQTRGGCQIGANDCHIVMEHYDADRASYYDENGNFRKPEKYYDKNGHFRYDGYSLDGTPLTDSEKKALLKRKKSFRRKYGFDM